MRLCIFPTVMSGLSLYCYGSTYEKFRSSVWEYLLGILKNGARGTRTLMTLRSADFKSAASTIPPSPQECDILILSCFCLFVNHFDRSILDSWLADYAKSLSSRCCFFSCWFVSLFFGDEHPTQIFRALLLGQTIQACESAY
jgi:hypothetical protein